MKKIIYQFCFHNYKNEFEMLSRISYTVENYKEEMIPIESYCYNHDLLKKYSEMLLVDIIPPFLNPKIFTFDFDDFETENEMMKEITETILNTILSLYIELIQVIYVLRRCLIEISSVRCFRGLLL